MNCRSFQAKVASYADQELSGREMQAMQQHANDCRFCASELLRERELKSMLGSLKVAEPSSDFESRLLNTVLTSATSHSQPVWQLWRTAMVAALAGALAVFVTLRAMERGPGVPAESIDFNTDQAAYGTQDAFGGAPVITVGSE